MTEHLAAFPILSCMLLAPPAGLFILLCLREDQKFLIKAVSLVAAGVSLALAIYTFVAYDRTLGGLQFVEQYQWVQDLRHHLLRGSGRPERPPAAAHRHRHLHRRPHHVGTGGAHQEYFICQLALVTGVFGVFMSYESLYVLPVL